MNSKRGLIQILALLLVMTAPHFAAANDDDNKPVAKPTRKPALMQRVDDDDTSAEETHHAKRSGHGFGVTVQGYYDPLSSYLKLETSGSPSGFGSSSSTGFAGMQVMLSYTTTNNFELSTGFDYLFPVNAQGQQAFVGSYAVNSQTINIMGLRLVQVGYKIPFGNFSLVPYGGIGLYYGKNVIDLTSVGQVDTITLTKLTSTFTAGLRGDLALNDTFSFNVALEGFLPYDVSTQLSQSGTSSSELPGYESNLQSQMNFMDSFGIRIMGGARVSF